MYVIGHRGAGCLAPENSLAAFERALKYKVDAIEFDVQSTADGVIVLSHDPQINGLNIQNTTLSKLLAVKPDLATLQKALNFVAGQVAIVIDVKPGCDPLALIEQLRIITYTGQVTLSCLRPKTPRLFMQHLPGYEYALQEKYFGVRAQFRAKKLGIKRLHFQARVLWGGFIYLMSRRGWLVYAYTVNDPPKAARWARQGLKGVFTDRPDKF